MMGNQSLCDNNMVEEEEAEYVLLDLDGISSEVHIPPNAPYVLSVRFSSPSLLFS